MKTNMYGITPCPKCGENYRWPKQDGNVVCDDCGFTEKRQQQSSHSQKESAYAAAVRENTAHLTAVSTGGLLPDCDTCDIECTGREGCEPGGVCYCDEPWFSWSPCDVCGSTLGGDREVGHGIDKNGDFMHLHACTDCVIYLANGDEPEEWSQHG